jgi:hypothetical protein
MEITYSPAALPGSCYFCGSGGREFYVDTGVSVEFHGAMYICNICCEELARTVKFIPHDEYKELKARNEELSELTYQLRTKLDVVEESLRGLVNAGYRYDGGSVIVSGGAVLEDVSESEGTVSEGTGELGEGEGTTPESSDDEGVVELRSDDASDAPFDFFGGITASSKGNE